MGIVSWMLLGMAAGLAVGVRSTWRFPTGTGGTLLGGTLGALLGGLLLSTAKGRLVGAWDPLGLLAALAGAALLLAALWLAGAPGPRRIRARRGPGGSRSG